MSKGSSRRPTNAKKFSAGWDLAFKKSKTITDDDGVPVNCPYCDGTGDVHSITGEWLGPCKCGGNYEQHT